MIPDLENSTKEEREEYIRNRFRCISDCESGIDSVKNRCLYIRIILTEQETLWILLRNIGNYSCNEVCFISYRREFYGIKVIYV